METDALEVVNIWKNSGISISIITSICHEIGFFAQPGGVQLARSVRPEHAQGGEEEEESSPAAARARARPRSQPEETEHGSWCGLGGSPRACGSGRRRWTRGALPRARARAGEHDGGDASDVAEEQRRPRVAQMEGCEAAGSGPDVRGPETGRSGSGAADAAAAVLLQVPDRRHEVAALLVGKGEGIGVGARDREGIGRLGGSWRSRFERGSGSVGA